MEAKVWTIKALTEWTTKFLASKGVETPLKETRTLLAHVLACKPIDVVARSEEEPSPTERSRFKELIQRRADGWPTAYLTGVRDFYMLAFEVNPAVLIPRPDTEMLVVAALDHLKTRHAPQILDLGTGSGCIAVSLAHQLKSAHVTAIDISPDALDTAKRNATTHQVASRMTFHLGDLFAPLPPGAKFDAILSNPPYIPPMELASLAVEVREHEPHIASTVALTASHSTAASPTPPANSSPPPASSPSKSATTKATPSSTSSAKPATPTCNLSATSPNAPASSSRSDERVYRLPRCVLHRLVLLPVDCALIRRHKPRPDATSLRVDDELRPTSAPGWLISPWTRYTNKVQKSWEHGHDNRRSKDVATQSVSCRSVHLFP